MFYRSQCSADWVQSHRSENQPSSCPEAQRSLPWSEWGSVTPASRRRYSHKAKLMTCFCQYTWTWTSYTQDSESINRKTCFLWGLHVKIESESNQLLIPLQFISPHESGEAFFNTHTHLFVFPHPLIQLPLNPLFTPFIYNVWSN